MFHWYISFAAFQAHFDYRKTPPRVYGEAIRYSTVIPYRIVVPIRGRDVASKFGMILQHLQRAVRPCKNYLVRIQKP